MPIRILFLSRHGRIVVSFWLALGNPFLGGRFGDTAVMSTTSVDARLGGTVQLDLTGQILDLGPIVHLQTWLLNENVVIMVDQSSRLFRLAEILLFTYEFFTNFA